MKDFFSSINRQFNGFIVNLAFAGVLLLLFAVLVVWSPYVLQLVIGCGFLIAAWIAFYVAYKLYKLKSHLKDFILRIK